jgi:restriction system protein
MPQDVREISCVQDVLLAIAQAETFVAGARDIEAPGSILQRLARAKAATKKAMDNHKSWLSKERPFVSLGTDPGFMDTFWIFERLTRAQTYVETEFPSLPTLLVKSIIRSKSKSSEGRLIQSIATPWLEIVNILSLDPIAAFQIPSAKWEEIIAGAYHKAGFDEVVLTPRSGDYGRDIIATKRGLGSIRVLDQVKAYHPGHLVTANDVRALYGVVVAENASKGFLTTTSDFAPRLRSDLLLAPLIPSRIELVDGKQLIERLGALANTVHRKGKKPR